MVVRLDYELITFFSSVILGFFAGAVYDLFRAFRFHLKKAVFWDILLWSILSFSFFYAWYHIAGGILRWYMVFGVFFAAVIYFFSVSKFVFFVFSFLVGKICAFFCIFFKILLTPLRFLCKIISVYVNKAKSKFSKKVEEKYDEKKA